MKTDKALSSRRHSGLASAPSAAVASGASDCAGRIVYLRAIWPDKSWKETAERHVHHRAAHSTKGREEYIQSWWWEGWSVKNSFNKQWTVNMHANNKKCLKWSLPFLPVAQAVKGGKGHVDKYNLYSLALVMLSLFLWATFMPLIDF